MIIEQINIYLRSKDKTLHNIAIELANRYYPKWNLKIYYGKPYPTINKTAENMWSTILMWGYCYKNYAGKYEIYHHEL